MYQLQIQQEQQQIPVIRFPTVILYKESKLLTKQGQIALTRSKKIIKMLTAISDSFILYFTEEGKHIVGHYSDKGQLIKQIGLQTGKNAHIQMGMQNVCAVLYESPEGKQLKFLQWNIETGTKISLIFQNAVCNTGKICYFYFSHLLAIAYVDKKQSYPSYPIHLHYYKFPIQDSQQKPISTKINYNKNAILSITNFEIKKINNFSTIAIYNAAYTNDKLTNITTAKINNNLCIVEQLSFINKFNPNHKVFDIRVVDMYEIGVQTIYISFQTRFNFNRFLTVGADNKNNKKQLKSYDKLIKFYSFLWMYKIALSKPISFNHNEKSYIQLLHQNCPISRRYEPQQYGYVNAYNNYLIAHQFVLDGLPLRKNPVFYIDISLEQELQIYSIEQKQENIFSFTQKQLPTMSVAGYAPQTELLYYYSIREEAIKYVTRQISNLEKYRVIFASWMTQLMDNCDQAFIYQVVMLIVEPEFTE